MKTLTLAVLLTTSTLAFAGESEHEHENEHNWHGDFIQSQSLVGGASQQNAYFKGDEKKDAVSSAIAPAVSINEQCPVITVGGHSLQLFFMGVSTTGVPKVNPICAAILMQQPAIAQQILCDTNEDYKKASKKVGITCLD